MTDAFGEGNTTDVRLAQLLSRERCKKRAQAVLLTHVARLHARRWIWEAGGGR